MYSLASFEPDSCYSSVAPAEARIRSGQTGKSASFRQFGALVNIIMRRKRQETVFLKQCHHRKVQKTSLPEYYQKDREYDENIEF